MPSSVIIVIMRLNCGQEISESRIKSRCLAGCPATPPRKAMTSWFDRLASSHHVQLAATAVFSGLTVAGLIYGTQAIRRKEAVHELKASIPELDETHHADLVRYAWSKQANRIKAHQLSEAYGFRCCFATTTC